MASGSTKSQRDPGIGLASGATNTYVRQQIKKLRLSKGWTQKELAEAAGLSASSLGCLETGFYRFNLDTLQKLVNVLGVDIVDVWPPRQDGLGVKTDLPLRRAGDQLNFFRLSEVQSLTGAEACCLFTRKLPPGATLEPGGAPEPALRTLYSIALEEKERLAVVRQLLAGTLKDPWFTYSRCERNRCLYLCLKNAAVDPCLQNLIERFLNIWVATLPF